MAETGAQREDPWTSLSIRKSVAGRLKNAKPYSSMSYDDLLREMVDEYEEER